MPLTLMLYGSFPSELSLSRNTITPLGVAAAEVFIVTVTSAVPLGLTVIGNDAAVEKPAGSEIELTVSGPLPELLI